MRDWSWAQPGHAECADLFRTAGEAFAHAKEHACPGKGVVWLYCQDDIADDDEVSPWLESAQYFWNCDGKLVLTLKGVDR